MNGLMARTVTMALLGRHPVLVRLELPEMVLSVGVVPLETGVPIVACLVYLLRTFLVIPTWCGRVICTSIDPPSTQI